MICHPRPKSLLLAATLLLVACRPDPVPPAASAEPVKTSSAPASASAASSSPAPAITHQPGTVPSAPARKPAAAPDAGAAAPPTFTRLPAARSRKAGAQLGLVSSAGKGALVALVSAAGIEIIDPATGAGYAINQASVEAFAVSPDESLVAVTGAGKTTLWDAGKGTLLHTFPASGANVVFSGDGKKLGIAGESLISVRDTATGDEIMKVTPDINPFGLAFGANGKDLVVTGNNTQVVVYALDGGKVLPGGGSADTSGTFGIALSPDGRFAAASAPAGHGLHVFDVRAWAPRTIVVVPEGACKEHVAPTFSPNGRFVFAYGGQRWVKGFEAGTWKPYASYHAPPGREVAVAAADLSRVVVTKEEGRDAVSINVGNGAETKLERGFPESASYAFSNDGLHVAATAGGAARVWAAKSGKVEYEEQP